MQSEKENVRNLVLVFGDQLDGNSRALSGFDRRHDAVLMAETEEEARYVWSHKLRITLFVSAMRHFREVLKERGFRVFYHELTRDPPRNEVQRFTEVFASYIRTLRPEKLVSVEPGDHRVMEMIRKLSRDLDLPLEIRPDDHFLISPEEFIELASGKKHYLMESFYRTIRRRLGVLITPENTPVGGKWNFDHENRLPFGTDGPGTIPPPKTFPPDTITKEAMMVVNTHFSDHPGRVENFSLPVTAADAQEQLDDFIENRLRLFGTFEDAMWSDEPYLYHSRLSTVLNLKLLSVRLCTRKIIDAFRNGEAPLNSVEAFIRQIIGWREFIRGIYWMHMPSYRDMNHLGHELPVPGFFWTAETDMECLRNALMNVVENAYTHHIERLMVIGLFALLLGVHPLRFHEWHMAMYADALDWVSLPNTLGMSQYGDGGIVGTKPYCASGNYINRMSNFCTSCRYTPGRATGQTACPFTTLYWDFLDRHFERLSHNPRLAFQIRNIERKRDRKGEMDVIRAHAHTLKSM